MSLPVHLVPGLAGVTAGQQVEVSGDEAHHAVAVRRLRTGEQVLLTDGTGTLVRGEVESTGKRFFAVRADVVDLVPRPEPELVVVQAIPKGDRGELAVEVLTEIGVGVVVPWAASRCVAVWKGERATRSLARWRSSAREAGKQARRAWAAEVSDPVRTPEVVDLLASADAAYVLHEEAASALAAGPVPESGRVVLVVGPEGGLAREEIAAFEAAGARSVRLGTEVLRTSTAGLAAAAALLSRTDRWGQAGGSWASR